MAHNRPFGSYLGRQREGRIGKPDARYAREKQKGEGGKRWERGKGQIGDIIQIMHACNIDIQICCPEVEMLNTRHFNRWTPFECRAIRRALSILWYEQLLKFEIFKLKIF